jgi:hypothetical protein
VNRLPPAGPFAEIIESSLHAWKAQCWDWEIMPAHGTILSIPSGSRTLFGIVHASSTGSIDQQRTVYAYKKTEEQLKQEHPHIFEFLTSTFECLTLGYYEEGSMRYHLAPTPPKIHAFVQIPDREALAHFFSHDQYLHMLFAHEKQLAYLDDLLLAVIEQLARARTLNAERLRNFMHTFSLLTANDYRRMKLFIQRAHPLIEHHR